MGLSSSVELKTAFVTFPILVVVSQREETCSHAEVCLPKIFPGDLINGAGDREGRRVKCISWLSE